MVTSFIASLLPASESSGRFTEYLETVSLESGLPRPLAPSRQRQRIPAPVNLHKARFSSKWSAEP